MRKRLFCHGINPAPGKPPRFRAIFSFARSGKTIRYYSALMTTLALRSQEAAVSEVSHIFGHQIRIHFRADNVCAF